MSLVFISYRREDSAGFAGRLHESLERRLGEGEVFRDADALAPGQDFVDAIDARLRDCKSCLVLIGREWLDVKDAAGRRRLEQQDDYVRLEIAGALARPDVLVVPVLVEGMSMPTAAMLPESIRALSRRQAVSLRDETWDTDVDRLVMAIQESSGRAERVPDAIPTATPSSARARPFGRQTLTWAALAVVVLAAVLGARTCRQADEVTVADTSGTSTGSAGSATSPAYAIAIPRLSEVEHGDTIYTLLSGGVTTRGNSSAVRLRFRFSNEGRYPANFWDSSFRLAAGGQVLAPTSGLNDVVDGHTLQQGIVSFDVPANTTDVVLHVLGQDGDAQFPLDLRSTGAPSDVEKTDTTDALSRAVVVRVVRDPRPLLSGKEVSYTLNSVTARRFVNTLRIVAGMRVANQGRYPWLFGSDAVRLLADGQATAPVKAPNEPMQGDTTALGDFVFDVAPSVRTVALVAKGEPAAEVPLDLPSAVR